MSSLATYTVDVIAGDGIGLEVMPAAIACVDALAPAHGFRIDWRDRDWGSDYYRAHGRMMPVDGIDQLATGDATLLGAVGAEDIPDDVTLWGLLIPIRREFDQYVNLRPIRILPGVTSPLAGVDELDMVVVRENVEGEYSEIGGRMHRGRPEEAAIQEAVFTRTGVRRVAEYAVEQACQSPWSPGLGDQVQRHHPHHAVLGRGGRRSRRRNPGLTLEKVLIDALAARLVLKPHSLDVIVASNLFGDILSDLAAAVAGSIGVAPSANLNPPRRYPSMFEPVHGSAPDIAGQGVANPVGQMWAAAMMLDHLGERDAANGLRAAFEAALARRRSHPRSRRDRLDRRVHSGSAAAECGLVDSECRDMTYVLLVVAVASGVSGTLCAKASDGFRRPRPTVAFLVTYGFALFLLMVLMERLPLGVLYALWGGARPRSSPPIDRFWFGQRLKWTGWAGLALVALGSSRSTSVARRDTRARTEAELPGGGRGSSWLPRSCSSCSASRG